MTQPRRAVIVIDVQNEYANGPLEIQYPPREAAVANAVRAIDAAIAAEIPVITVQHEYPEGAPVFAAGSEGVQLQPEIAERSGDAAFHSVKALASVFNDDALVAWLRDHEIDTVTLVGFMTNNCVLASAAGAEPLGLNVEVLSDATGAINIANEAGSASAQQVHETLMALLHSNWAAVATTDAWASAVVDGAALEKSNLVVSALQGHEAVSASA
ncbi:isochorismatase family protein [Gulosibacter molinativorax]|uniref:Isochorismatase n=1 Tax=Gulosibacter molinativorax TaxID=256821 RepID=A0ABT7C9N8_9MICO|nr:isochorismatase family protein [Gulosibacter molinativorax]MDJ1371867.1 isochorismatase [Gulosibacter molinativorax]QUY62516.1 Isochorismatase family protein YecD [Gulosibacter molinativorax]